MRVRFAIIPVLAALSVPAAAAEKPAAPAPALELSAIALPGAPPGGMFLDYLAVDRARGRVYVPAGATGNVVVIDTKTHDVHPISGFPTAELERRGRKFHVGPSSATIAGDYVYVGNRADSSVCAVSATTLARGACVKLPSSPDGVAYVAATHEVWVTTPRDKAIAVLDVAAPGMPKLSGSFTLEGSPEGYAVDDQHGVFYTNLEDKDRTLRIDVKTRKVTATWQPECGEAGPRGLTVVPADGLLVVACTDHLVALAAGKDGKLLSKLATGQGVDDLDYLPATRSVYAAAGRAGTLTIAHLDASGTLTLAATRETEQGARNAVVSEDGVAFIGDGPAGKVIVVSPAKHD
jgi:DNA-binding beta-propeller fold protein YncE